MINLEQDPQVSFLARASWLHWDGANAQFALDRCRWCFVWAWKPTSTSTPRPPSAARPQRHETPPDNVRYLTQQHPSFDLARPTNNNSPQHAVHRVRGMLEPTQGYRRTETREIRREQSQVETYDTCGLCPAWQFRFRTALLNPVDTISLSLFSSPGMYQQLVYFLSNAKKCKGLNTKAQTPTTRQTGRRPQNGLPQAQAFRLPVRRYKTNLEAE